VWAARRLRGPAARVALQHAASIASLLLMTEALITDIPADEKTAMPAMPHGEDF
jgi:chaperonin GroEL (HSP60 family)